MVNSYFLRWNFDWKSCFVVWNEWKNPQFDFLSQNFSIERNFFAWDGKETKILHLLFHRIWKKEFTNNLFIFWEKNGQYKYMYRNMCGPFLKFVRPIWHQLQFYHDDWFAGVFKSLKVRRTLQLLDPTFSHLTISWSMLNEILT